MLVALHSSASSTICQFREVFSILIRWNCLTHTSFLYKKHLCFHILHSDKSLLSNPVSSPICQLAKELSRLQTSWNARPSKHYDFLINLAPAIKFKHLDLSFGVWPMLRAIISNKTFIFIIFCVPTLCRITSVLSSALLISVYRSPCVWLGYLLPRRCRIGQTSSQHSLLC